MSFRFPPASGFCTGDDEFLHACAADAAAVVRKLQKLEDMNSRLFVSRGSSNVNRASRYNFTMWTGGAREGYLILRSKGRRRYAAVVPGGRRTREQL